MVWRFQQISGQGLIDGIRWPKGWSEGEGISLGFMAQACAQARGWGETGGGVLLAARAPVPV